MLRQEDGKVPVTMPSRGTGHARVAPLRQRSAAHSRIDSAAFSPFFIV